VIFVTAHAEHALDAFDGGAIDYVLKPVQASRLKTALDRARARQRAPTSTRLPVQTRNGVVLIAHETITHVVIEGASVVLYTPDDRYFLDLRLSDVERALPDALLRRVHRNALVNLDHVQRFEAVDSGGYIAHIGPDAKIAVSRKAARELRRHWKLS
jgi:two-component system LytT family response regulator